MKHRTWLRRLFGGLFFLLMTITVRGQFDAHFSQYWALSTYYHSASVGQSSRLNIYGTYGMQLMGFERAPRVMCLGAEMPFRLWDRQHGVGIGVFNEGIGLFRNQRMWLQYAFHLKFRKALLGIGLQLGFLNISFDPTDMNLGDENEDPAFPSTASNGMAPDVGLSVSYNHPKFFLSFSGHHLTAPRVNIGEKSRIKIRPILYFTGGYNIQTRNPLITIQPSCHLQTDFRATRFDLTGRLFYTWRSHQFNAGLGYSPDTSVTFSFGMKIRSLNLGYAYELFTSKIGAANGSHDIVVSYAINMNVFKKNRNLHKSVRIL